MAVGLRLPLGLVMELFLFYTNFFKYTLSKCNIFVLEQSVGPGLQHLCCKAINKNLKN